MLAAVFMVCVLAGLSKWKLAGLFRIPGKPEINRRTSVITGKWVGKKAARSLLVVWYKHLGPVFQFSWEYKWKQLF
jgi:hypothetical protein